MVLRSVDKLEQHGKFDKALAELDKAELDYEAILVKSRILHFLNHFMEAYDTIDEMLDQINQIKDPYLKLGMLSIKSEFHLAMGEVDKAAARLNEADNYYFKLKKQTKKDPVNIWYGRYLHTTGQFLQKRSEYKDSMNKYEQSLKVFISLNNKREEGNALNSIGGLHSEMWKLDNALKYCTKSLKIRRDLDNEYDIANSLNHIGIIYGKKNQLDKALEYFTESKNYYQNLNNQNELVKTLNNISHVYRMQGNLKGAKTTCKTVLDIATAMDNKENLAKSLLNLSVIELDGGELEAAKATSLKALEVVAITGNLQDKTLILNNLGVINKKLGHTQDALNFYKESLVIEKQLDNKKTEALLYHNIGSLYYAQGDQKNAKSNFEQSLLINQELDGKSPSIEQAKSLQFIGMILLGQGETKDAIKDLEQALTIAKTYKNEIIIAEVIYNLFLGHTELNENKIRNKYYNQLKKLGDKSNNKTVRTRSKLAEAMMIQMEEGSRMKQMVDANNLFTEVLDDQLIDIEFTIFAMLNRCEYLLAEFRMTKMEAGTVSAESQTREVLEELKALITTLYDMAQDQESHSLLLELLIIQSKLSMLEYNIQGAKNYLENAIEIAERMELNRYKIKISKALHNINLEMEKYAAIKLDPTTQAKMEAKFVQSYLEDVAVAVTEASTNHFFKEKNGDARFNANLNLTNLLKMDEHLPPKMRDYIKFIGLSVNEYNVLQNTYKCLQDFEEEKITITPTEFNLLDIVNEELDNIQDRIDKLELDISFNKGSYDETSENVKITTDKSMFSLVLQNILINAAKFNFFAGYINVLLLEEKEQWMLVIQNHSKVIPKDKINTIFDKYVFHEHDRFTRKQGAGLGLHFIQITIQYLGGDIKLYSPIPDEEFGVQVVLTIPKEYTKI